MNQQTEIAVFGGGCFWCVAAVFERLRGVKAVAPGYAGGTSENPAYEAVSSGKTGHAEVVKIEYDPEQISYDDLLAVFFASHDPTTLNRQGNDAGTQYRSVIFYATAAQKKAAEEFVAKLNQSGLKAVTKIEPLGTFYEAEDYHRQYYQNNPAAPYCQIVIDPKIEKLERQFQRLLIKADML